MAHSLEALRNGSPRQASIAEQALLYGRYVAGDKNENAACTRLNGRGLLRRDPKNGFVWYPTDALALLLRGKSGGGQEQIAPPQEPPEAAIRPDTIRVDLPALTPDLRNAELVVIVERARALFDQGDVQAALKLSSIAYDQARAAATSAERVRASRTLIDKARRMQADALKIESLCSIAMADAIDEAQARGELARIGRPSGSVRSQDIYSLEDVGVDRRRLFEARKVRDAVRTEPAFIDRVIEARLSSGLEPSRASIRNAAALAVGTRSATRAERGEDLYETPIEAIRTLLAVERFGVNVLEPSVGKGAILRPLEEAGYEVVISDLVDRGIATRHGECQRVGGFLHSVAEDGHPDIVTNPPYGIANAYIAHALRVHRPHKMAMLLNLNFLCGFEDADRCYVMDQHPPSRIHVFTRRLPMMHRDGWDGNRASSQMNTAWFVWQRNDDGSYGQGYPQIIRLDWKAFEHAEALAPITINLAVAMRPSSGMMPIERAAP